MIEFISKIEIVDSDLSLESESDHNRRSNSDRHFDSTTTIRFGTSNRISLLLTYQLWDAFEILDSFEFKMQNKSGPILFK